MNGAAPRPGILQGREAAPAVPPWLTHTVRPLVASAGSRPPPVTTRLPDIGGHRLPYSGGGKPTRSGCSCWSEPHRVPPGALPVFGAPSLPTATVQRASPSSLFHVRLVREYSTLTASDCDRGRSRSEPQLRRGGTLIDPGRGCQKSHGEKPEPVGYEPQNDVRHRCPFRCHRRREHLSRLLALPIGCTQTVRHGGSGIANRYPSPRCLRGEGDGLPARYDHHGDALHPIA